MIRVKHGVYYGVMVLLVLGVLELMSSVFYFQYNAEESFALSHYIRGFDKSGKKHPGLKAVGIWQLDERYGFSHIAKKVGTHETADYKVTYTIGKDQERFIPAKPDVERKILFLGGSYAFGQGVADDESYPAILGHNYWNQWAIENRAVMAWGTAHALLALSDALESETPPTAVIYGMIPHHVTRNYIRRSWVKGLAGYGLKHPHFELKESILEYQGVVGPDQSAEDSPVVRQKELALTAAMLTALQEKSAESGIPFIIVLLPKIRVEMGWPPQLIRHMTESGMNVLDISEMQLERFSDNDRHPNIKDHERIAEQIDDSFVTGLIAASSL